jgi:hypothetical protein
LVVNRESAMYEIIDRHAGNKVVGKAKTLKAAIRSVDRRDNAYGGYRYQHRKVQVAPPFNPDDTTVEHED